MLFNQWERKERRNKQASDKFLVLTVWCGRSPWEVAWRASSSCSLPAWHRFEHLRQKSRRVPCVHSCLREMQNWNSFCVFLKTATNLKWFISIAALLTVSLVGKWGQIYSSLSRSKMYLPSSPKPCVSSSFLPWMNSYSGMLWWICRPSVATFSLYCKDLTRRGLCLINSEVLVVVLPECFLFCGFNRLGFSFDNYISFVI